MVTMYEVSWFLILNVRNRLVVQDPNVMLPRNRTTRNGLGIGLASKQCTNISDCGAIEYGK